MSVKDRNEYLNNYKKEKLKRIPLDVRIEKYEDIKRKAEEENIPVNTLIKNAIDEKMNGKDNGLEIKDLEAYARSLGMTTEEYIKQAVLEKMKRQDEEYREDTIHEKVED